MSDSRGPIEIPDADTFTYAGTLAEDVLHFQSLGDLENALADGEEVPVTVTTDLVTELLDTVGPVRIITNSSMQRVNGMSKPPIYDVELTLLFRSSGTVGLSVHCSAVADYRTSIMRGDQTLVPKYSMLEVIPGTARIIHIDETES